MVLPGRALVDHHGNPGEPTQPASVAASPLHTEEYNRREAAKTRKKGTKETTCPKVAAEAEDADPRYSSPPLGDKKNAGRRKRQVVAEVEEDE